MQQIFWEGSHITRRAHTFGHMVCTVNSGEFFLENWLCRNLVYQIFFSTPRFIHGSHSWICLSCSMRPNIFLGVNEGSAQYRKWYYELIVDHMEPFVTAEATQLRIGWASTPGYSPYPGGGEGWGGNGVGDDLYSYGFDGLHLWSGES